MKESTSRVTVVVRTALLQQARALTGQGVTGTVREGLRQIVSVHAQKRLRELRGKLPISTDLEAVSEDRALDSG
ncbi:MAG: type II toxin-antitoxin system VapB family antitoxin [Acidobacteriota bacterium]|nr:type II toxin-antitoxin system VapB family antitoxin [Acidobacteriota bacterium]